MLEEYLARYVHGVYGVRGKVVSAGSRGRWGSGTVMQNWAEKLSHIRAVLCEEEPGAWSAQCLEYDIGTQAHSLFDVQDELLCAFVTHIAASIQLGREPFAGVGEAPKHYWALFENGLSVESRPSPVSCENIKLPPIRFELRITRSPAAVRSAA
jgi:hypothetical protein